MTTPNVPLRMEFSVELPGTPEQVWDAIATTNGISSWFLPTDVEEHEGGAIVLHMGDTDSPGTITGWDPPRRLEYSEPEWATLTGHDLDSVTPMVTEFLVEAQSGGTRGVTGQVERLGQGEMLLRLTDPVPGFLGFFAHDKGDGSTMTAIQGYLFSDDASGYVDREQSAWKAWLESLDSAAAHR